MALTEARGVLSSCAAAERNSSRPQGLLQLFVEAGVVCRQRRAVGELLRQAHLVLAVAAARARRDQRQRAQAAAVHLQGQDHRRADAHGPVDVEEAVVLGRPPHQLLADLLEDQRLAAADDLAHQAARVARIGPVALLQVLGQMPLGGVGVGHHDPPHLLALGHVHDAPVRQTRHRQVRQRAQRLGDRERAREHLARIGQEAQRLLALGDAARHRLHRAGQMGHLDVLGLEVDGRTLAAADGRGGLGHLRERPRQAPGDQERERAGDGDQQRHEAAPHQQLLLERRLQRAERTRVDQRPAGPAYRNGGAEALGLFEQFRGAAAERPQRASEGPLDLGHGREVALLHRDLRARRVVKEEALVIDHQGARVARQGRAQPRDDHVRVEGRDDVRPHGAAGVEHRSPVGDGDLPGLDPNKAAAPDLGHAAAQRDHVRAIGEIGPHAGARARGDDPAFGVGDEDRAQGLVLAQQRRQLGSVVGLVDRPFLDRQGDGRRQERALDVPREGVHQAGHVLGEELGVRDLIGPARVQLLGVRDHRVSQ